jgi:uncharacterized membrane protein YcjF (UPF0283 family)
MKKIITFLKNWFEKNGLIKILVSFAILIICSLLIRKFPQAEWIAYIGGAAGIYLLLTVVIFTIAGIVNSVRDLFKKKE